MEFCFTSLKLYGRVTDDVNIATGFNNDDFLE